MNISTFWRRITGLAIVSMLAASTALTSGCAGSDPAATKDDTGNDEVTIGLTDAAGDFLSYSVNVKSLQLQRANGASIETLPNSAAIDFAQYVDATEFLTTATVPAGRYEAATLVLDYSDAYITVEDDHGEAVTATLVDNDGNPVDGEQTIQLQLNGDNALTVRKGAPAHITLDFDLAASHRVDLSQSPPVVTMDPVLVADTRLTHPKSHRLRGLLESVDLDNDRFSVIIRPLHRREGRFGQLQAYIGNDTAWEINGQSYAGTEGLSQLATLPAATAVIALGAINTDSKHFEAEQVFAGSSIDWNDKDSVTGHVVARRGNTLTVRGATLVRRRHGAIFNDNVTITLAETTKVVRQGGWTQPLDITDISVGQRITATGHLTSGAIPELDASEGVVRLRYTTLNGTVAQLSPLTIAVQRIDRRPVKLFDFSGTGSSTDNDADPAHYEIDTGALSLTGIALDDPIKIRGFVNAFGAAPADFTAKTISDVAATPAQMRFSWNTPGSTAAFSSTDPTAIAINLEDDKLGDQHHLWRAGIATDLTTLGADPVLTPDDGAGGIYAIAQQRRIQVFTQFDNFQTALANRLDGATAMRALSAQGHYDAGQNRLTSRRITARLQ